MNKPSQVLLRLNSVRYPNAPRLWWQKTAHLQQLFTCVHEAKLWSNFAYYGKDGSRRLRKLRSRDELLSASRAWKPGLYTIQTDSSADPTFQLGLSLAPGMMRVRFFVGGADLDERRSTILDQFIDLTVRLHTALHDIALFGPEIRVDLLDFPYPRVRPPRETDFWFPGSAVNFLSKKFQREIDYGDPEAIAKMLKAPMPEGTQRLDKGDLLIFRWVDDLFEGTYVAERLSLQEQWFVKVLNSPIDSSYNEAGDYHEAPSALVKKPPLTFYDPMSETGYKAVVLSPDSSMDEELFGEIAAWVRDGTLPDGTPLHQLILILPSREAALRIHERAMAIGVAAVYYTDDQGRWWNPFPPGLWIE
jgi:hypothetical protein